MNTSTRLSMAAVVALGLAACGDDDDDNNPQNPGLNVPSTVVRGGSLTNVAGTPSATGGVSIRMDAAGKLFVYLDASFMQEMGPGDTEVRLAKSDANAADQIAADAGNVSPAIGIVPNGGSGEFLFEIPTSVTQDDFNYVIIWCPTAGVNFGVAQIGMPTNDGAWTVTLMNVAGTPNATGMVSITQTGADSYTIALGADFMQEMGPGDTEIRLARMDTNAADQIAADASSVSPSLGIVPNGGSGAMTFDFTGIDPSLFSYVIIWCPTAGVNFGVGALNTVN